MDKWIDVNEQLPKYGEPVLICVNGTVQYIAFNLDANEEGTSLWFYPCLIDEPEHGVMLGKAKIHWMQLPEPPTQ